MGRSRIVKGGQCHNITGEIVYEKVLIPEDSPRDSDDDRNDNDRYDDDREGDD